jgi:hypothetical protein
MIQLLSLIIIIINIFQFQNYPLPYYLKKTVYDCVKILDQTNMEENNRPVQGSTMWLWLLIARDYGRTACVFIFPLLPDDPVNLINKRAEINYRVSVEGSVYRK